MVVGLRPNSASRARAEAEDLLVLDVSEAVDAAEAVMLALPDQDQPQVYDEQIAPVLRPGHMLLFAHGFNIHYGQINPPPEVDVAMVAPKGPGHVLRDLFVEGVGVPGLVAVHQDATGRARDVALSYAKGIGCAKAGLIETTFQDETETDLFGEQAVLCGGVTALVKNGFETLVEAGYDPRLAYFECLHELKLIVDLIYPGRDQLHALLDQRHGRVRRPGIRAARGQRQIAGGDGGDPGGRAERGVRAPLDSRESGGAARV